MGILALFDKPSLGHLPLHAIQGAPHRDAAGSAISPRPQVFLPTQPGAQPLGRTRHSSPRACGPSHRSRDVKEGPLGTHAAWILRGARWGFPRSRAWHPCWVDLLRPGRSYFLQVPAPQCHPQQPFLLQYTVTFSIIGHRTSFYNSDAVTMVSCVPHSCLRALAPRPFYGRLEHGW